MAKYVIIDQYDQPVGAVDSDKNSAIEDAVEQFSGDDEGKEFYVYKLIERHRVEVKVTSELVEEYY